MNWRSRSLEKLSLMRTNIYMGQAKKYPKRWLLKHHGRKNLRKDNTNFHFMLK